MKKVGSIILDVAPKFYYDKNHYLRDDPVEIDDIADTGVKHKPARFIDVGYNKRVPTEEQMEKRLKFAEDQGVNVNNLFKMVGYKIDEVWSWDFDENAYVERDPSVVNYKRKLEYPYTCKTFHGYGKLRKKRQICSKEKSPGGHFAERKFYRFFALR